MSENQLHNPWVGPSSYQDPAKTSVKVIFCGRENETFDLTHLIEENFLVTLYGKSGNGKTSLLQAGVFPQLRRNQYLPVVLRLGTIEEDKSFQTYIIQNIENEISQIGGSMDTLPVIEEQTDQTAPDYLWNYFARHHLYNQDGDVVFPVLVFDQFEEVLRSRKNIERTETLLSQINYIIDEGHALNDCIVNGEPYVYDFNFRFVISIREDELFRLEDCIDNIYQPSLKRCRYRLNALSSEDARNIILKPGQDYIDHTEQSGIVNRIIDSATNKEDGNISPFMLSLICSELFKKAYETNAQKPRITATMIDQLGQNILRDFYLGIVTTVPDSERIFLEDNLVDANRMRNSVNVGMMDKGCPSWHSLTEGSNRILQETNGKVELVHDQLAVAVAEVRENRKEQERLGALMREKEEMRRKNRRRMLLMGLATLIVLGAAGLFAYQNVKINKGQEELEQAYSNLTQQNAELDQQRQDLLSANKLIQQKGDSLQYSSLALASSQDSLQQVFNHLTAFQEALKQSNWEMMENQARYVAQKAIELAENGDSYTACLLALEILPKDLSNPDRPYTPEGELSLRTALNKMNAILKCPKKNFFFADFSPDGQKIVSASKDGAILIWDAKTGKQIKKPLESYGYKFLDAKFSTDSKHLFSITEDGNVFVWDTTNDKPIGDPRNRNVGRVLFAKFSHDGKKIVTASWDGTLCIWDTETGRQIGRSLEGHSLFVSSADFSPDGKQIVSASMDKTIRIWNLAPGKESVSTLMGQTAEVNFVKFSPDGKLIVTASDDKNVRLWDAITCLQIGSPFQGHMAEVNYVNFSPDSKLLVSTAKDGTIRVWDVATAKEICSTIKEHNSAVYCANFSPDRKCIISTSEDGTIKIWEIEPNYQRSRVVKGHTNFVNYADFSPNGKLIVSASRDSTVRIWNTETGEEIRNPLRGHTSFVNSANFSPDGKLIISASSDGTVLLWDAEYYKKIDIPLKEEHRMFKYAAISPDVKQIVSTSFDGSILLNNTKTNTQIELSRGRFSSLTFKKYLGANSANFSPNGKYVVSASKDGTVCLWDIKKGNQNCTTLEGHTDEVSFANFSPDGKLIVSSSYDKTIRIWDTKKGSLIHQLEGHTQAVNCANFSRNNKYIVSASNDKTIRIWDAKTGKQISHPLVGHTQAVNSVNFSPDGKSIVSASSDSTIRIWEWKPLQELIDETRKRFENRQLTSEERAAYYLE